MTMMAISVAIAGVAIALLTSLEYKYERARLSEIAQSRARLIESLTESEDPETILKILTKAHQKFPGFAETGEFTLGTRQNDNIVFLLNQRHSNNSNNKRNPIAWDSKLAEPMRRALQGQSGTTIALDYRGEKVIAAYEPIKILNWGIVVKIDVAEIWDNVLINHLYITIGTIIINLCSFILVRPIFQRLEKSELKLQQEQEKSKQELERKVIQRTEALSRSEAQFRAIFENSAIGIIVINSNGQILQTNKKFQNLANYQEHQLNKLNLVELIEQDNLENNKLENSQSNSQDPPNNPISSDFISNLNAIANQNTVCTIEKRLITSDQQKIWVKLTIATWNDFDTQEKVLVVMADDITERKEVEKSREKLIRRNQSLIQSLGEIVYEHLVAEDIINWDGSYTELLGYSQEEMGHDGNSWLNKVHPDDLESVTKEFERALHENHLYRLAYRFQHYDGSYLWFYDCGVMYINSDNQLTQVIGVMRNITTLKAAENILKDTNERYETILSNTREGFFIIDLSGSFLEVNDAYCQMIGYSRETLLTMSITDVKASENIDTSIEINQHHGVQFIQGKKDFFETRHRCKDGKIIELEVSSSYIKSQQYFFSFTRDITERKLAEKELEESKLKYQRLVENIGDNFVIYSHTGNDSILTYVSEGFQSIFGKKVKDVLNKSWIDVIDWQSKEVERARKYNNKLLQEDQDLQQFEMNFIKPSGMVGTLLISQHLSKDKAGNVIAIEGIAEDITERKKAEKALQESEIKFRTFVQTAGTIIIIMSPDYKVMEWNDEAERIYGYSREQILGEDYSILCLLPQERQKIDKEIAKILAGNLIQNFEHAVLTKDGETRNILWNLSSFSNAEGEVIGIAKVGQDITERKKAEVALQDSEQKLRTLADFTYDWEYWLHPNGSLVYISPSCERITGYHPDLFYQDPELLNKIIYPEDRELFDQHTCQPSNVNQRSIIDYRILTSDGKIRWISHVCRLVYNHKGEYLGIRVSNRDISDRKKAEEKLQEVNQQLRIANQELMEWNHYLEQRNQEMQLLEKLNDFLSACLTLQEAYQAIPDLIQPLFPNSSGAIYIVDHIHHLLNSVASWGDLDSIQHTFSHNDCWALRRGQLHVVDYQQPNLLCKHVPLHDEPLESLCVPMMAQGNTIGLVYIVNVVRHKPENTLIKQKQTLAKAIAEQLSLSLANLKLRETLQSQSTKDSLTGLFNRRYMEDFLKKEFYQAQCQEYSVGIMMLDVDHFKAFNDRCGHDAGDAVLREIGNFLLKNIRGSDIACRYGGEELMLILPEADLANTHKRAEMIREGIKQLKVQSQGKLLGIVTISIGIACFPQHGQTYEKVIQAADNALYEAKAAGRDRVKSPQS